MNIEQINRLMYLMDQLGINQRALADRILCAQKHMTQFLQGQTPLGAKVEERMYKRLGVNPQWWKAGDEPVFLRDPRRVLPFKPDSTDL